VLGSNLKKGDRKGRRDTREKRLLHLQRGRDGGQSNGQPRTNRLDGALTAKDRGKKNTKERTSTKTCMKIQNEDYATGQAMSRKLGELARRALIGERNTGGES